MCLKMPEVALVYIVMWITSQIVRSKDDEQKIISCDDLSVNECIKRDTWIVFDFTDKTPKPSRNLNKKMERRLVLGWTLKRKV